MALGAVTGPGFQAKPGFEFHKKKFSLPKDKKISLIRQISLV
jgi:hypothetical protein